MPVEKLVVPDFGSAQKITVIEVFIKPGDQVEIEAAVIALESEKAVMEIPSPYAGVITAVHLKEGDTVNSGDLIAEMDIASQPPAGLSKDQAKETLPEPEPAPLPEQGAAKAEPARPLSSVRSEAGTQSSAPVSVHATPSVRAYARELGADLAQARATGPKGRILKEDVQNLVKQVMASATTRASASAASLFDPPAPLEDFSLHGPVEDVPLNRIQKISGPHLHKSWVSIPLVTHFEEADITGLEQFRQQLQEEGSGKFSPLVLVIKAVTAALQTHPLFNSSLVPGEKIILKRYYHIGIAVDTAQGLTVPVIKHADRLGLKAIAAELSRLSTAARESKLNIADMQGASFTISSLGGIGGTGFTPIVSAPQAAILGLVKSSLKPVWDGQTFVPRLMLPFAVSYDHRIVDGAEAARFCRTLRRNLEELKRTLL